MRSLTAERRANRGREGGEEKERERDRERKKKREKEKMKKVPCMSAHLRNADCSPPQAQPAAGVAIFFGASLIIS